MIPAWYQIVSKNLKKHCIQNCNYLYLVPQKVNPGSELDVTNPLGYTSKEQPNMDFESYVKSIDAIPDSSFNLVFIDGRARPSCILHALSKVRPGGYVMLDNSERGHYKKGKELLTSWQCKDFFGQAPMAVLFGKQPYGKNI